MQTQLDSGQFSKTNTLSTVTTLPPDFTLTPEFKSAFELMENTQDTIFLTGRAGTGKSTLLSYFRQNSKKNIAVVSPTGIAAMNIGGQTIHSFFDFPLTYIDPQAIHSSRKLKAIYENIETIVVDEISMVRADMLDGMDKALRVNKNSTQLFGGVQMIFIGDLFQLPPVVADDNSKRYLAERYDTPYFFSAKVFSQSDQADIFDKPFIDNLRYVELESIFRQKDIDFKNVLNRIRVGKVEEQDLDLLNTRLIHIPFNVANTGVQHVESLQTEPITLTTTNKVANNINTIRLEEINSKEFIYNADISGDYPEKSYPTDLDLKLKIGAQVMMLKNDQERRFVNGSLGVIDYLDPNSVSVRIGEVSYKIEKSDWRVIEYGWSSESKRLEEVEKGSFHQYPLKLAWAVTIHKSQGQTFDKVKINLGTGAFAHGQLYVALSRCKSLEGISLTRKVNLSDVIVDARVQEFVGKVSVKLLN